MSKFKGVENNLIWEKYSNPVGQYYDDEEEKTNMGFYDDEEYPSEDAEVVMEFEPVGPVEPEDDFDDMFESEDDDDTIELDNEIIVKSLRKLMKRANILLNHCESDKLDTWMVAKIIKAEDYISDVWNELDDVADFANDGFEDSL
jgi:c-di-AMP phosphodiesterase-like protein